MIKITFLLMIFFIIWCGEEVLGAGGYGVTSATEYSYYVTSDRMCINSHECIIESEVLEYVNNEFIYITCDHMNNSTLVFRNKSQILYGPIIGNAARTDVVSMLVKLTPYHDGSMFQCDFNSTKLTLTLKFTNAIAETHIEVNGLFIRQPHSMYYLNTFSEHLNLSFYSKKNYSNFKVLDVKIDSYLDTTNVSSKVSTVIIYPTFLYRISAEVFNDNCTNDMLIFNIASRCETLCFDPYFTGLNVSKVLAKYRLNNNHSVIHYQLDFEETDFFFGCKSNSNRNITVNRKTSEFNTFQLRTKKGQKAFYMVMNCSLIANDRKVVSSTILNITRKRMFTPESTRLSTEQNFEMTPVVSSVEENQTPAPELICEESSDVAMMLVAIFVTMICTAVTMVIMFYVYLKKYYKQKPLKDAIIEECEDNAVDVMEHIYEPVNYTACKSGHEEPSIDISNRPQYPLPPEEREENKKYIHYDTPYEQRIFRFGVRTQGHRNGPCRGHRGGHSGHR